jgi:hypothetical protein
VTEWLQAEVVVYQLLFLRRLMKQKLGIIGRDQKLQWIRKWMGNTTLKVGEEYSLY